MATSTYIDANRVSSPKKVSGNKDARRRPRLKISLPLEVRPFDARFAEIVDVGEVLDFTRDGLYFATCMPHYFMGMRLLVTFPFGEKISAHKKFLGSIVRMENRPEGTVGVAVRFLL
jgi:hypothetical protein